MLSFADRRCGSPRARFQRRFCCLSLLTEHRLNAIFSFGERFDEGGGFGADATDFHGHWVACRKVLDVKEIT